MLFASQQLQSVSAYLYKRNETAKIENNNDNNKINKNSNNCCFNRIWLYYYLPHVYKCNSELNRISLLEIH